MRSKNKGIKYLRRKLQQKRYAASYTIEMAYIMAVFCFMMVVLVQKAYAIHDETKNGMELQEAVELVRHREDRSIDEIREEMDQRAGLLLSMGNPAITLEERSLGRVSGTMTGDRKTSQWSLEISSGIYEPEQFLRQVAALKQLEERDEGELQEGDAS